MVQEMTVQSWCDACDLNGDGKRTKVDTHAANITVDVGTGPHTLDLCKKHRAALIEPLTVLLEERGVRVAETKPRRGRPPGTKRKGSTDLPDARECPECGAMIRGSRVNAITHVTNVHGIDTVSASKLIPPDGDPVPCPECGFVTGGGGGLPAHYIPAHGREAYDRAKESGAV